MTVQIRVEGAGEETGGRAADASSALFVARALWEEDFAHLAPERFEVFADSVDAPDHLARVLGPERFAGWAALERAAARAVELYKRRRWP